jgi:hypothetical protein
MKGFFPKSQLYIKPGLQIFFMIHILPTSKILLTTMPYASQPDTIKYSLFCFLGQAAH